MRLTIDSTVLDKYNITLEEFLLLFLNARTQNIKQHEETLIEKELADRNVVDGGLILSDNTKELLSSIVIDSDSKVINKDEEFLELAEELRKLYPTGRKEGTTYMWRGTAAEVAKKLKTLVVKYGYSFTKEQAVTATKEYIASFNGNYRYMKLLKYFILKATTDMDDNRCVDSMMMSYIENEGQTEQQRADWVNTLK